METKKENIKIGKVFTILIITIICIIGIVLLFLDTPLERMQAFKLFIDSVFLGMLPLSCGVSIGGLVKKVFPNGIKKE